MFHSVHTMLSQKESVQKVQKYANLFHRYARLRGTCICFESVYVFVPINVHSARGPDFIFLHVIPAVVDHVEHETFLFRKISN